MLLEDAAYMSSKVALMMNDDAKTQHHDYELCSMRSGQLPLLYPDFEDGYECSLVRHRIETHGPASCSWAWS
jgi:hypothetical protein